MMLLDKITLKVFSPSLYLCFLTHTDAPLCNPHDVACLLRSVSRKMSSFPRVLCVSGYLSITLHSSKPNMKFKARTTSLLHTASVCELGFLPSWLLDSQDMYPRWESQVEAALAFSFLLRSYVAWLTVKARLILNLWSSYLNFLSAGRHHSQPLSYSRW